MSLLGSAPLSNVTVYREEFIPKTAERRPKAETSRDCGDPLSGPDREFVLPYCKYNLLPKPNLYPEPKKYVEEVCQKYPAARAYLKDPPLDYELIDRLYDDENRTSYMVSYCKRGDFESKASQGTKRRTLPEDWRIPETTQRCSYRHPRVMAPEGLTTIKIQPPLENLRPNPREREVLQTKTGDTDYMGTIGRVGQEIIDGKLHGDINMRPRFDQEELIKAKLIWRN